MSNLIFTWLHRVTYAECTLGNHVYYSRYLELLEAARGEFFRHLGMPLPDLERRDLIFPVLEVHVRYRGPARYADELEVRLWTSRLERVRLGFGSQIIGPGNRVLIEAETAHVCTSRHEKPRRLPEEVLAKLRAYHHPRSSES